MLHDKVQELLKTYHVEKGRFRKAGDRIPVVGRFFSQTPTIKAISEIEYTKEEDNNYWYELFKIISQYQRPARLNKTTEIVDKMWTAMQAETPWQNNNELFINNAKRLERCEILNRNTFSRLCGLENQAENFNAGLECLENGSEKQRQEEKLMSQDNLLDENNFYLSCLVAEKEAAHTIKFAIGMHYLHLASLDYQRPIDLLMKPEVIALAAEVGRLMYVLEKNQQFDDAFLEDLRQNPAQAYDMLLAHCNSLPTDTQNSTAAILPEAVKEELLAQPDSVVAITEASSPQPDSEVAVTQPNEQPASLEEALQKFSRLKLEIEIDPEVLRQNPHHANAMVECFSELNTKGIMGKESLDCLLKKPSSVTITTHILCDLHRIKALKDNRKKLKAHINAVKLISEIIALMDQQSNGFNRATADVLFKHLGEIKDHPKQFKAQLEALVKDHKLNETSFSELIKALPALTQAASFRGNRHTLYQNSASNTLTKANDDAPAATPKLG